MSNEKQRFLFLVVSYHTVNFFKPIITKLLKRGHSVRILAMHDLPKGAKEDGFDTFQQDWHHFKWDKIESFNPTRVVVFNGSFGPINAATCALKKRYPLFCAEVAWFPQSDYIYIDRNIHHLSNVCLETVMGSHAYKQNADFIDRLEPVMEEIKEKYKPSLNKPSFVSRDKTVIIPLQLSQDTSILYSSPYFKTMDSLIGFALHALPDQANIVVKPHPKMDFTYFKKHFGETLLKKVTFIEGNQYSLNSLIYHSRMALGINSTGLMEALVHNRPVYQLGKNICQSSPGSLDKKDVVSFYKSCVEPCHITERINKAKVLTMIANQVNFRDPPEWAISKLENYKTSARTMEDLARERNL